MTPKQEIKLIDNYWVFAVAVACTGPFALPLLWRNPRLKLRGKIIATVLVVILTVLLTWGTGSVIKNLMDQLHQLQS